ncbi:hypothetical protein M430DRAFT_253593 [Amorphotheca resinae ATCC 22711]|uniref:Uncharacterized protein n=1 Tax=Amorphotheca resinae ATCC 22711 TaxID=857342 RepID=A0A2T3AXS6_AMORE|nr:hypothetical protein M430DRAFT_253593 [Amorphotheca resinae ATCC 22711]PSS14853.1 hypothetical protein M430DRAFT_253593 [Amorphotheca resinae ATCC 22711]
MSFPSLISYPSLTSLSSLISLYIFLISPISLIPLPPLSHLISSHHVHPPSLLSSQRPSSFLQALATTSSVCRHSLPRGGRTS